MAVNDQQLTDYYETLNLERAESLSGIQEKIQEMKVGWGQRATRAGSNGDEARLRMVVIEEALRVFANEDSREQYDLELSRSRRNGESAVLIGPDWSQRAWDYYFVHDLGAARVAASKAKQENPNESMPYVISAWINLGFDEHESAKRDADEAFVLEDGTGDSVDVHEVRGVTFHLLGNFDSAINSFKRALTAAGNQEKIAICGRMGYTYLLSKRDEEAFDNAIFALSNEFQLPLGPAAQLVEQAVTAVIRFADGKGTISDELASYKKYMTLISESGIQPEWKTKILESLQLLVDKVSRIAENKKRIQELRKIKKPEGARPDKPWKGVGVSLVSLLLSFVTPYFLVIFVISAGYSTFRFISSSNWNSAKSEFDSARNEIDGLSEHNERLQNERLDAKKKIAPLTLV